MQTHQQKFIPTLALNWYPQDLIGQANLFDISIQAIRIKGGNAFSVWAFPVWPTKRHVLQRAVCHLASYIDNNYFSLFPVEWVKTERQLVKEKMETVLPELTSKFCVINVLFLL